MDASGGGIGRIDCYEDMFKEITKKLYGEDLDHRSKCMFRVRLFVFLSPPPPRGSSAHVCARGWRGGWGDSYELGLCVKDRISGVRSYPVLGEPMICCNVEIIKGLEFNSADFIRLIISGAFFLLLGEFCFGRKVTCTPWEKIFPLSENSAIFTRAVLKIDVKVAVDFFSHENDK